MSCAGTIAPDTQIVTTVASSSGLFRATCAGQTIVPSIRNLGSGNYEITIDADDVRCPGPVVLETKDTEGVWQKSKCWKVEPCP